jgi:hypothetical protein
LTIVAIHTQATVISASLSQIQTLLLRNTEGISSLFDARPELYDVLDMALTGCMVVFSCLDEEVRQITGQAKSLEAVADLGWQKKLQLLWNEDKMKELLQHLHGQSSAVALLIQVFQMYVICSLRCPVQSSNIKF